MIELSAPREWLNSTTTSVTYPLEKYSHSYPTSSPSNSQNPAMDAEWQHFVHPVINLIWTRRNLPQEILSLSAFEWYGISIATPIAWVSIRERLSL
ncbi:uncharacterized protein F5891DRAFT_1013677 [Suillus fuscotomentosus]|uniref:Uncharacterized protein n=1 Tax=Suillus fuscotomentosus TaxID=1912939 RepID=A0AAD4EDR8_9AGAM|nr:uncharacterized protein F5891DRAFT_1013677 [Suillus fuscotomentosus]KAG1904265.1 hypothetical protein F5891DRAFT_1013677 [Suillus fuscotomentosus]